jgi:hypothetical protein
MIRFFAVEKASKKISVLQVFGLMRVWDMPSLSRPHMEPANFCQSFFLPPPPPSFSKTVAPSTFRVENCRKLSKIDQPFGRPRTNVMIFKNIFAEKNCEKIGVFDSQQS